MKKITALILAVFLLTGLSAFTARPAAAEGFQNLLEGNGGFETLDANGYPVDWVAQRMTEDTTGSAWKDNPNISVDTVVTYGESKNSVKFHTTDAFTKTLYVQYKKVAILPNTRYRLSAQLYASKVLDNDGKPVRFKIEYYTGNPSASTVNRVDESVLTCGMAPTEAHVWQEKSDIITPPAGTVYALLYCFVYPVSAKVGEADVYLDNVSLTQMEEEKKLEVRADQYFYYSDAETGYASARVYDKFSETYAGGTVDFTLYDTDGVNKLKTQTRDLTDGAATFDFPLSLLSQKKTAYTLSAVLKDADGNIADTSERQVHLYDRPQDLDADGQLLNGSPGDATRTVFTGTLGYGTNSGDTLLYGAAKKMGINLLLLSPGPPQMYYSAVKNLSYDSEVDKAVRETKKKASVLYQWLEALKANNMKGIIALYQGMEAASHPQNYEKTRAVVRDFMDHEAVAGWCVMDEPFDMLAQPEDWLLSSYKLIRDIDDRNPVYFVDNSLKIDISSVYCDIVAVDPYPSYPKASMAIYAQYPTCSSNPATYSGETTAILRRTAERYGKSFMTLNPAFDYNGYYPKTSELRSFWYQSIFEGAHGAGWYSMNTDNGILVKANAGDTAYRDFLEEFALEEQPVAAELFGRNSRYPLFTIFESADYAYKGIVKNGDLYMLVINRRAEPQTVTVPLTSQNGLITAYGAPEELYAEGTSVNPVQSGGTVTLTLPAANVSLIRFACAVASTERLGEASFDDLAGYDAATIEALYRANVLDKKGERAYLPADNITRGDFAKYLIRALDLECMTGRGQMAESFTDVSENATYYREVRVGRSLGIFRGAGDGSFSPEAPVTGQEARVLCERALRAAFKAGSESANLGSFSDSGNITRGEAAAILMKLRQI